MYDEVIILGELHMSRFQLKVSLILTLHVEGVEIVKLLSIKTPSN